MKIIQVKDGYQERRKLVLSAIKDKIPDGYGLYKKVFADYTLVRKRRFLGRAFGREVLSIFIPNLNPDWNKKDLQMDLYDKKDLTIAKMLASEIKKVGFETTINCYAKD